MDWMTLFFWELGFILVAGSILAYEIRRLSKIVWEEDLIMCPSQLRREIKRKDMTIEFYCRWRWDDPWTFKIIVKREGEDFEISPYEKGMILMPYFEHDDYKKLERWIDHRERFFISLARKLVK